MVSVLLTLHHDNKLDIILSAVQLQAVYRVHNSTACVIFISSSTITTQLFHSSSKENISLRIAGDQRSTE